MSTPIITTAFTLAGYGVLGYSLTRAIAHWTVLGQRRRALKAPPLERLESHFSGLEEIPLHQWRNRVFDAWRDHPVVVVIHGCLERPQRLADPQGVQTRLALEIQAAFADLLADAHKNMATAPMWGMFFTILGFMIIGYQIGGASSSIQTLLGALGPALGTSALGSITAILEKNLIQGQINPQIERMHQEGARLLLTLTDGYQAAQAMEKIRRLRLAGRRMP